MTYLTLEAARPRLQDEMSRALRTLFEPWEGSAQAADLFVPAVDIVELEQAVLLYADLPGIDPHQIDVAVENRTLTLSGERPSLAEAGSARMYRVERHAGRFTRTFSLPATVDTARIAAEFDQGVLKVTLPKAEQARARKIEVSTR
jgi:HSP20 family protein